MNEKLLARLASLSPKQRELLEKQLSKNKAADEGSVTIPRVPRDRAEYPLSYTQTRMWWVDQVEPGNPAYIIPVAVRFRGTLDRELLERSLNECIKRHEALRTTFHASAEGHPMQRVTPSFKLSIPFEDLSALPEAIRTEREQQIAVEVCSRSFSLAQLPLIRTQLLRLQEQEHLWVVAVHHIVFDGWSTGVFVQEVATLYETYRQGATPALPAQSVQVIDYALWQRESLTEERVAKQLAYWKEHLQGSLPVLELPIDHARPAVRTYSGRHFNLHVEEGLPDQLQELSRQEEVTLFVTLMAAFQTVLYRYTALEDILVGYPIAGRDVVEIHGLIGAFINSLPLRSHVSAALPFRELLQQVKTNTMRAYEHQDVPLEMVMDAVQPERVPGHTPLFQVMFNLNKSVPPVTLHGLTLEYELIDHRAVKFDLSVSIRVTDTALWCTFEYNSDLFEEATISRLAKQYRNVLRAVVQDPSQALGDLEVISEEEMALLFDVLSLE